MTSQDKLHSILAQNKTMTRKQIGEELPDISKATLDRLLKFGVEHSRIKKAGYGSYSAGRTEHAETAHKAPEAAPAPTSTTRAYRKTRTTRIMWTDEERATLASEMAYLRLFGDPQTTERELVEQAQDKVFQGRPDRRRLIACLASDRELFKAYLSEVKKFQHQLLEPHIAPAPEPIEPEPIDIKAAIRELATGELIDSILGRLRTFIGGLIVQMHTPTPTQTNGNGAHTIAFDFTGRPKAPAPQERRKPAVLGLMGIRKSQFEAWSSEWKNLGLDVYFIDSDKLNPTLRQTTSYVVTDNRVRHAHWNAILSRLSLKERPFYIDGGKTAIIACITDIALREKRQA